MPIRSWPSLLARCSSGDLLQWHPHLHLITTDGRRSAFGSWHTLAQWDAERLMRLFRERLLGSLLDKRAISKELVQKLLAWRHPGFSAHVGEPIAAEDERRLEDTAVYLVRNPLSLKKLVYLDGRQAVLYRSRMNPALGRDFEAMDPLEWLARMSDHIPDPGQHRTLFYGECSNRARGAAHCSEPGTTSVTAEPQPRRRCSPSWARLIAKVFSEAAAPVKPLTSGRLSGGGARSPQFGVTQSCRLRFQSVFREVSHSSLRALVGESRSPAQYQRAMSRRRHLPDGRPWRPRP
jgi:hypothetical protein